MFDEELDLEELLDLAEMCIRDSIKTIEVYVKPEENVAYYVVNGEGSDDWKVSLD